ncbi:alpha integrin [Intrasporangium chromatireducens Q5-1]|uniref:Alpha integrin n=1 Tax=Intrasporangium chromatireducens Q5-1 TaxID=584657 RepID=W9GUK2_9MICO|nr:SpoIID/LytB domain-containing protein [Intrasporangium chromatireducens]EWT07529.1 alpha integrin [Intrasporangium chromatireducens Q5-1]
MSVFRGAGPRSTTVLLATLLLVAVSTGVSAPAQAATTIPEIYRYPAGETTVVALTGHGYGHGRGLSQNGARGAADAGLTWQQTLAFYYPGAGLASWPVDELKVRLDQVGTSRTYLQAAPGLQVSAGRSAQPVLLPVSAPNGKPAVAYQIVRAGSSLQVEVSDGSAWTPWDVTGSGSPPATPFVVSRQDGGAITTQVVKNTSSQSTSPVLREYRGRLVTWPGSTTGTVMTVNELSMELYLRGVVPSEMPASWPAPALSAQAVAARTYAAFEAQNSSSSRFDICDTTWCQVYRGKADAGRSNEYSTTNAAVAATAQTIVMYSGKPAFTQFSASNGGYSVAGSLPYLVAKADPYDGRIPNTSNTWSTSIAISGIEQAYPAIGKFRAMRILSRDGRGDQGGRILQLALDGTSGSVQVTGPQFASRFGLRQAWFRPTNAATPSAPAWPRDFNQDERADVMTLLGTASGGQVLTLHRGDGSGYFIGPWVRYTTDFGRGTRVLTTGPWDLDDKGDLLAIRSDGSLWLYRGNGLSEPGPATSLGAGWGGYRDLFGVGDIDGDGRNDLVARHPDGALYIVPGNATGGLLPRHLVGYGWAGFTTVFSPGDFNGDGNVDLMSRDSGGTLYFYPGKGNGTFGSRISLGAGWSGYTALLSPGDFTGDGRTDVVARGPDGVLYVWAGAGNGRFIGRTSLGAGWASYRMVS